MGDTSDSDGGRRGSIFGWLRDLIDFIQVVAVVMIAVMVFFRPDPPGPGDDKDKACRSSIVIGLLTALGGKLIPAELTANVEKYLDKCESDPDVRYVMKAVSEAANDPRVVEAASPPTVALGPTVPFSKSLPETEFAFERASSVTETDKPRTTPPAGTTSAAPLKPPNSGWVAVGFVGDETLFVLPPGRTLQTLAVGDELTAKRQINLRKTAADWTRSIGIVRQDRKVKIVEAPKTLSAGSLTQVWAHVELP